MILNICITTSAGRRRIINARAPNFHRFIQIARDTDRGIGTDDFFEPWSSIENGGCIDLFGMQPESAEEARAMQPQNTSQQQVDAVVGAIATGWLPKGGEA